MLGHRRPRPELGRQQLADGCEIEALPRDGETSRVEPGEIEQIGRKLLQPRHLLARLVQELRARLGVEILAREQLEEAAEREQRRAQLVRGVGDELAAGAVERRELEAHALERAGELAELVRRLVDHGLIEAAARDALRGALETTDAAGEERGERVAEQDREDGRERPGDDHTTLHDADRLEVVVQRRREEHDRPLLPDPLGRLRVALLTARDLAAHRAPMVEGPNGDRVVADVAGGTAVRVGDRVEERRAARVVEDDDARVRERRRIVLDPRLVERRSRCARQVHDRAQRVVEVGETRVDERALVRRNDDDVDDRQGAGDDEQEREREPAADRAQRVHGSRKR